MWHLLRRYFQPVAVILLLASIAYAEENKNSKPGAVVDLTDDNFDEHISKGGIWFVKVFAPWCSHCRQMEPVWVSLAQEMSEHDIHIGNIDGTRNRLLMSRFGVEAYPSMFLLREGRTWAYQGPRSLAALKEFALTKYSAASPLPPHKCPNHWVGRALGKMYGLPSLAWRAYTGLKEEGGWSDLGLLGVALAVPLVTGGVAICLVDALYVQRGARRQEEREEVATGGAPVAAVEGAEGEVEGEVEGEGEGEDPHIPVE